MTGHRRQSSRRDFMGEIGRLAIAGPLLASLEPESRGLPPSGRAPGDWDLSWVDRLDRATDLAAFDWPSTTGAGDFVLDLAGRFLDGCDAVYGRDGYRPGLVLNARTRAIAAGMSDALWAKYRLGGEYKVDDPGTEAPALRNPLWRNPEGKPPAYPIPTIEELTSRGAIVLVCDFAMGHLARRLAEARGEAEDAIHADLRGGLLPGAFAVPSGIFGLARAQNAGCALIRT